MEISAAGMPFCPHPSNRVIDPTERVGSGASVCGSKSYKCGFLDLLTSLMQLGLTASILYGQRLKKAVWFQGRAGIAVG